MPPTKQRTFLTNAQKLQLKAFWSAHPDLQQSGAANWAKERFGVTVGRATLYRIQRAPAASFQGNARQKKKRSVKFPALERDILKFCEERRERGVVLSDEVLLQAAAELRGRHGIAETELKLSNGWLHRFKERHALRSVPPPLGESRTDHYTEMQRMTAVAAAEEPDHACRDPLPGKPAARRPSNNGSTTNNLVNPGQVAVNVGIPSAEGYGDAGGRRRIVAGSSGNGEMANVLGLSNADDRVPTRIEFPATSPRIHRVDPIQPLTYLSATAVDFVTSIGFVKWKFQSGMAYSNFFSVDIDGVAVLRDAKYQLNVELQHTAAAPLQSPSVLFKVWGGIELLGQCEHIVRIDDGRALSVLQLVCTLPAHTVVRVEYHAPGAACTESRLVLRLLA